MSPWNDDILKKHHLKVTQVLTKTIRVIQLEMAQSMTTSQSWLIFGAKIQIQYFWVIFNHFENHSNQSHDFLKLISYFLIGKPAKNSLVGRVLKNSNYKQGQKYFVEWWLRLHHQRWFYNGMRQKNAQDTIRI